MPYGIYNPNPVKAPAPTAFNSNPAPQPGFGVYGGVPGPVGVPNPAGDLGSQYPNLGKTNATLSNDILAQLGGQLSPGTLRAMQDYQAQFAAGSGMPGSNAIPGTLAFNRGVRDIGTTAEAQVRAGQQAYNPAVSTISGTQTVSPALQTSIAERNATMASAPNPTMAQSYAQQLYDQYLQQLRGPGGGTRGGFSPGAGTLPPPGPTSTSRFSPDSYGGYGGGTGGGVGGAGTGGSAATIMPYSPDAYTTGADGANMVWTGQDFSDLFDSPYSGVMPPSTVYNPTSDTMDYNPFVDLGY